MTLTTDLTRTADTEVRPAPSGARGGRWLDDWHPEHDGFWETTGRRIARRNLVWSIFVEHIGFSIWMLWSVCAALLAGAGFDFTTEQLFVLIAIPSAVGAFLRIPYTFAVPVFGGRNWTVVSALLLLVPTALFAVAVQNPATPFWAFCLIAVTAGFGGGNFASSMANINAFYPAKAKGLALGLNAAGGNLGVAVLQLVLPVLVGAGGLFGLVRASQGGVRLELAGYVYGALALGGAAAAYLFMNNITGARSSAKETAAVMRDPHTWIMSFLYLGTFGSFIGFAAAMPLVIKLNFSVVDADGVLHGINFAYVAFLGATIGSLIRPVGGVLADRLGGARVGLAVFGLQGLGTLGIIWALGRLAPNPEQDPAIAVANEQYFPAFLAIFLLLFAFTGIGNGALFKMIPAIWRAEAVAGTVDGTPERAEALQQSTRKASAVVGLVAAVGAFGGFLVPMTFGAQWVDDKVAAITNAYWIFTGFYVVCAAVLWFVYLRRTSPIVRSATSVGTHL